MNARQENIFAAVHCCCRTDRGWWPCMHGTIRLTGIVGLIGHLRHCCCVRRKQCVRWWHEKWTDGNGSGFAGGRGHSAGWCLRHTENFARIICLLRLFSIWRFFSARVKENNNFLLSPVSRWFLPKQTLPPAAIDHTVSRRHLSANFRYDSRLSQEIEVLFDFFLVQNF